jgi:hypothetical protein
MWKFALIPVTSVFSLLFGLAMLWIPGLSPWSPPLHSATQVLLKVPSVQSRFELSVRFCGRCGDRYLLITELFILFALVYSLVILATLFGGARIGRGENNMKSRRVTGKAAGVCFIAAGGFLFVVWSLLFYPGMAEPSSSSPSYSDYTMFDYKLLLLVTISFHIAVLFLMILGEIVTLFLDTALNPWRRG